MTNGPLENNKLLRTIVYVIREVGLTTVVMLVFLGVFIGYLNSPMTETKTMMLLHADAVARHQIYQTKLLEELISAQRTTCIILAKTEADRRFCAQ